MAQPKIKSIRNKPQFPGKFIVVFGAIFATFGCFTLWHSFAYFPGEAHPQTAWAACNANSGNTNPSTFTPLGDAAAATLVTHEPEIRVKNATAYSISGINYPAPNNYVPSSSELSSFLSAIDEYNKMPAQENPYAQYVDGLDGLNNPSTDDLIQWGAHKWGIPEDWLRAQYTKESGWSQYQLGDRTTETSADYPQYPVQSRAPGSSTDIYESLGISQEKWRPADHPGGTSGTGTEPLRWKSTAFNIDYQGAVLRFYYDNPQGKRSAWGDASYAPCNDWLSLGGWFEPYPWNNSGQQSYVSDVQARLSSQTWTASSFINATLTFPAAITFNTGGSGSAPGDCNADGHVTIIDLSILLRYYNQSYNACDFNADGTVTILDLSVLLSNYGQ